MILYDRHQFNEITHDVIMGTRFLRKHVSDKFRDPDYVIAWDKLVEMGFFLPIHEFDKERYERTDLAMTYIQEVCNRMDEINQDEHPDLPLVSSEVGLYLCQKDATTPLKVVVDDGHCPRVATRNGGASVALMTARLLWDIEVGDAGNHILLGSRLVSGNGSYSYSFDDQTRLIILDESNTT